MHGPPEARGPREQPLPSIIMCTTCQRYVHLHRHPASNAELLELWWRCANDLVAHCSDGRRGSSCSTCMHVVPDTHFCSMSDIEKGALWISGFHLTAKSEQPATVNSLANRTQVHQVLGAGGMNILLCFCSLQSLQAWLVRA